MFRSTCRLTTSLFQTKGYEYSSATWTMGGTLLTSQRFDDSPILPTVETLVIVDVLVVNCALLFLHRLPPSWTLNSVGPNLKA